MKAARLYASGPEFSVEEVPLPQPAPDECLVRVAACGVCGSDLHIISGVTQTPFKPITLGHEASGKVVDCGSSVTIALEGAAVAINPILTCGVCSLCRRGLSQICTQRRVLGIHRDGAFAEFVLVPAKNLVVLPPGLDLATAALIEPAGTPFHALTHSAPVRPGASVVIVGVGGMGLNAVQIARLAGAESVIAVDVNNVALQRAVAAGATAAVNATDTDAGAKLQETTAGGAEIALDCVGRPDSTSLAIQGLRSGGVVLIAGLGPDSIELPPPTIVARRELAVRGVYGYTHAELETVAKLFASKRLRSDAVASVTYPLVKINEGFDAFRAKDRSSTHVLIEPSAQRANPALE